MRCGDFIYVVLWNGRCTSDHFLHGESDKHRLRYKQHTQLDGNGSNEYCHYAGDIYVYIGKRLNEHEPNGDDHLHADCDQCQRLLYVYSKHYIEYFRQTDDQFLHSQPHNDLFGFEQHAKLGNDGSNEYCHRPGNIHFHIRQWFDGGEPIRDDHLQADCDQCQRVNRIHGDGYCSSVRWSIGNRNHFVPRGNTRRGLCRLHNRHQWRLSAIYIFGKHELQLSSIARGDVSQRNYGERQQLTDRWSGNLHARICGYGLDERAGDSEHQHRYRRE